MMFKLAVLLALVACAFAAPKPSYLAAEPLVAAAPVAVAHSVPVATSYANTYKVSVKSPLIGYAPAAAAVYSPYVASPYAAGYVSPYAAGYASPYYAHAAPVAYL